MSLADADPLLRRLERRALVFCALAAVVTLIVQKGRVEVPLGVVGGGVLIGVSYWAIRSSIDGILALALPRAPLGPERAVASTDQTAPVGGEALEARSGVSRRRRAIGHMARFVGRYAVLAALAYVMLAWLRLHPVGMILGVSSIVVAAAIEAVVTLGRPARS